MAKYMAWSDDQDESEAAEYEAQFADDAASEHAESRFNSSDPFEDEIVFVKHDGVVRRFNVHVDYDPTFWSSETTLNEEAK